MLRSGDVLVQESVSKRGVGIVGPEEVAEVVEPRVERPQAGGRDLEELAPVRAGLEGSELLLEQGQEVSDGWPVAAPGEMDGDAGLLAARAHPEPVGSDGAHLRYPEEG